MQQEEQPEKRGVITNPAVVRSALKGSKKDKGGGNGKSTSSTSSSSNGTKNISTDRRNRNGNSKNTNAENNKKINDTKKKSASNNSSASTVDNSSVNDGAASAATGARNNKGKKKDKSKNEPNGSMETKLDVNKEPSGTPRKPKSVPSTPRSAHAKLESGEIPDDQDLKKILFPDLFGGGKKSKNTGTKQVSSSRNSNYIATSSQNNNSSNVNGGAESHIAAFAGSSFHSSPAPSALPRPSFKLKSSLPTPSTSAPTMSMFDKFMQADREEREQKNKTIGSDENSQSAPSGPHLSPIHVPGLTVPHFPQPHLVPAHLPFSHGPANVVYQSHPVADPQHFSHISNLHINPNPFGTPAGMNAMQQNQFGHGVPGLPPPGQFFYSGPPGQQRPVPIPIPVSQGERR